MVLIADIAGMAASITDAANEVALDRETIQSIVTYLENARTQLRMAQSSMASIPASVVGGSPLAAQLVHHSELANTSLVESIDQINKGLQSYGVVMTESLKGVESTDDQIAADLHTGRTAIGGATGPSGQG